MPDLPGCFSLGDTLDEAIASAEEAGAAWIYAPLDAGGAIPPPSSIGSLREQPAFAGRAVGVISVDPTARDSTMERVSITLPRWVLLRPDALAWTTGESRAGYIAHMTMTDHGTKAA